MSTRTFVTDSDDEHSEAVAFHQSFSHLLRHPAGSGSEGELGNLGRDKAKDLKAKAARKPKGKTMGTLNAMQLRRLDRLIGLFKRGGERKPCYVRASVSSDEPQDICMNACKRMEDGGARIIRSPKERSESGERIYSKPVTAATIAEHNVLDLFLTACRLLPGFEAASARRLKEKGQETDRETAPMASSAVKKAVAPMPYDGTEPPLVFDPPLFDRHQIRPSEIHNALALGSTGSGKTASFIVPVLNAMLAYRLKSPHSDGQKGGQADCKTASMLVIDPKVELLACTERKLEELGEMQRLVVLGQCDPISYFDEDDGLSLSDRFAKVKAFVAVSSSVSDDNRWQVFAEQFILAFLRDDQRFANATRCPLLESLAVLVTGDKRYLERNQWVALRKLLLMGMDGLQSLRLLSDAYDVLTQAVGLTSLDRPFARYISFKDGVDQYFYNARGALTVIEGLGSADIEPFMDFSVRRGLKPVGKRTDVAALIECGAVIVFQPRQSASNDLVGRALKSLFFRCLMERRDIYRPAAMVCDEFQRFITSDPETGEQNVLDCCRAYRINACFATQSVAALMAAMGREGGGSSVRGALDSIMVNLPTKVCFRTSDEVSVGMMKNFIPHDPRSGEHVLKVRPPSSLLSGECYYALQHEWGRTRYRLPTPATRYVQAKETIQGLCSSMPTHRPKH